jgi:pimeloyl-[acyl-carrier protein] methyl ester esterase
MNKAITISGWGQNFDALENIAPNAHHIDYKNCSNIEEFFDKIKGQTPDVLIGWSLGGQLALRAIDAGLLAPKLLVLLATPFQFITGKGLKCGMDPDTFHGFEKDFAEDPIKTLKQFSVLVAKNDAKAKEIIAKLKQNDNENISNWQYWLQELGEFSCQKLNFSKAPKTLVIHGCDDTIVDYTQSGIFRPLIKNYKSFIFENCGHAPHLHDENQVRSLINEAL